ncbi:sulfate adenylyltransferase subunit 1 [Methylicorpusculum sp.]|uniref:sulfate adenylyltransferase subunit 1 n=1 Tax=Methylicorpusculum sp. TaxID=2713644 RepID=UPI0027190332|nr:GTP-binding protein [Methylicorpusculum sp.]MDO8842836.1 GTP-binding protein [Methylicorpusculum sp.]
MNPLVHQALHTETIELAQNQCLSGLLRFITAGSVDDGKSTLIGRLLYDTGNVAADQLASIQATSQKRGLAAIDWSLLTDGLIAEREQGITIDVAYRYFSTARRKFIIGDAPGHEQYTRNMVTAASSADLAILLVDARKGVITQTRRHAYLAHLLGIRELVLAVNKMDLVDWQPSIYRSIVDEFNAFVSQLGRHHVQAIPLSALNGTNVATHAEAIPWYDGPSLLEHLESIPSRRDADQTPMRLPVQRVVRVMMGNGANGATEKEFRGYQGTLASGHLHVGDEVEVMPSGQRARVTGLNIAEQALQKASADRSVVVSLDREIDISRGDMLSDPIQLPRVTKGITADVCWLSEQPLQTHGKYLIKHTTRSVNALFDDLIYRVDVNTLAHEAAPESAVMNDILRVKLKLQQPLFVDNYSDNRTTGSFIVIDPVSFHTVAAGVII